MSESLSSEEQISNLLKRKKEIDALLENKYTETQRWLVDSIELLLELELKR
jgi:hypothetical protein